MTPDAERLIRETWPRVAARGDDAAQLFYDRLFSIAPDTRRLFAQVEMRHQGRKFIAMLDQIVAALDQAPVLVADVAALARRHSGYGAEPAHYASVGAALVWTVEQLLGEDATPDISAAWREAYTLVAAVMGRSGRPSGAVRV